MATTTLPKGIRNKPGKPGLEAYVCNNGQRLYKYFAADTPISEIIAWRSRMKRDLQNANIRDLRLARPGQLRAVTPPAKPAKGGYVYFLAHGPYIKIGKAKDVAQRLSELQTAHAEPLRLVAYIYTEQPSRIEAIIQKEYRSANVRGEWYRLSSDIARLIDKYAEIAAQNAARAATC